MVNGESLFTSSGLCGKIHRVNSLGSASDVQDEESPENLATQGTAGVQQEGPWKQDEGEKRNKYAANNLTVFNLVFCHMWVLY